MRALSNVTCSLAVLAVILTACSAATESSDSESRSTASVSEAQSQPTVAQCDAYPATIGTPLGQIPLATAVPQYCGGPDAAAVRAQAESDLAAMSAWGCSDAGVVNKPREGIFFGASLYYTVCPDWVVLLPVLPGIQTTWTWPDLEFACNAAVPVAPPGWINIAWGGECDTPGTTCGTGSCIGISVESSSGTTKSSAF